LSGLRRPRRGPGGTCFPGRGPTAPPVSRCPHGHLWNSGPRSCPCHVSTSGATAAVSRRIACFAPRSFPPTPAGGGGGGSEDGPPAWALGQASGARVTSRDAPVSSATVWAEGSAPWRQAVCPSLGPPGRARDPCRHPSEVGEHAHRASSQARVPPPRVPHRPSKARAPGHPCEVSAERLCSRLSRARLLRARRQRRRAARRSGRTCR
jgi:hypothetical protein